MSPPPAPTGQFPSTALEDSTEHQPRARATLGAALASGPSHAYLFRGPRGSGKRAAARAFAAEILATSADDPDEARRRALLDPSPHPDLVWLAPSGAQHLVETIREKIIRASAFRPFEGEKRVFVVEAAEALRDESQNALLKTLEEPPPFVHLILISSEAEGLLETVGSRCQPVGFASLPIDAVEAALVGEGSDEEVAAAARLCGGDVELGHFLLTEGGKKIRSESLALARAVGRDSPEIRAEGDPAASSLAQSSPPWKPLLDGAEAVGEEAEGAARDALEVEKAEGIKRTAREISNEAKRIGRRRRTEVLGLGLDICTAWFRDLAATASGADEAVFNVDCLEELERLAAGFAPNLPRRATELTIDTRRRLELNVSEELALEALFFRLQRLFASTVRSQ